ncbi:MAG TPA: glucosyl transferase [Ignavibacteriaceae bacterium]|nr:glucosyl transferase [Ignavibacteriaceae bacterium]
MKKAIVGFLLIGFSLFLKSCNTTEPPPNGQKPTLQLTLEDVSCIEAWIQLKTTNLQLPTTITLKQYNLSGDSLSQNFLLNTQDSLLYIDSLLPNQTYKFVTTIEQSNNKSNELSVTTMDTTSHNFTFETFTFGGTAGSSTLYDCAIISPENIWCVGEIYVADTSINGYTMYNAVHWDGSQWELKRIPFLYQADSFYNPIYAVFAFNTDDIWFGIGNLIHWDGTRYFPIGISSLFQSLVNKIWGSSSSDLYVVGNNGNIVHYNGQSWQRIESGTELNINDIWGDYNDKTGEYEILAVASNVNTSTERTIIKIYNNTSRIISSSPIQWSLRTVWFMPSRRYYVAGSGVYEKHNLTENEWRNNTLDITTFYTNRIRGNDVNDVVGIGAFGDFVHFNGSGWKVNYQEPELNYGSYLSLDIKEELVVAVGLEYDQAVIQIATKINQ